MARGQRNPEVVGREVAVNCGTLLPGGDPENAVVSVRLEEETRPDGTVLRRSVISRRPRVSKIWMKNSTSKSEQSHTYCTSCDNVLMTQH